MPATLEWLSVPAVTQLSIIILVMLLERLISWPDKFHPLSLFKLIAQNLARKVNPRQPRSPLQRRISGSLGMFLLLGPLLVIISLLIYLSEYPQFFDAFLLLIALRFKPTMDAFKKVEKALKANKKQLARHHLSTMVLRESQTLSPVGIGKSACESLLTRFSYQVFCVVFWFTVAGGLGAITVRLVYEVAQNWNVKLPKNKEFGKPAAKLAAFLIFIPNCLYLAVMALSEGLLGSLRAFKSRPGNLRQWQFSRVILGGALGFQLSGPVIYQGNKYRFARLGGKRELRYADLARTRLAVNRALAVLLVMSVLWTAINYALAIKPLGVLP